MSVSVTLVKAFIEVSLPFTAVDSYSTRYKGLGMSKDLITSSLRSILENFFSMAKETWAEIRHPLQLEKILHTIHEIK